MTESSEEHKYKKKGQPGNRTGESIRRIEKTKSISRAKHELAFHTLREILSELDEQDVILEHACFIIAGDIVFNMAHDVPRPERSTGKMVRGSDMDIVVIVDEDFPERLMNRLDAEIYKEKYRLLINPHLREEIDWQLR